MYDYASEMGILQDGEIPGVRAHGMRIDFGHVSMSTPAQVQHSLHTACEATSVLDAARSTHAENWGAPASSTAAAAHQAVPSAAVPAPTQDAACSHEAICKGVLSLHYKLAHTAAAAASPQLQAPIAGWRNILYTCVQGVCPLRLMQSLCWCTQGSALSLQRTQRWQTRQQRRRPRLHAAMTWMAAAPARTQRTTPCRAHPPSAAGNGVRLSHTVSQVARQAVPCSKGKSQCTCRALGCRCLFGVVVDIQNTGKLGVIVLNSYTVIQTCLCLERRNAMHLWCAWPDMLLCLCSH